jgi:hypothetical protein
MEIDDFYTRDTQYINKIPKKISNKFKPTIKNKKVVFETKSGEQADRKIEGCLLKDPTQQKRVEKLKYQVKRKKKPETILKEFYDNYRYTFTTKEMEMDFNIIIKQSKEWINK